MMGKNKNGRVIQYLKSRMSNLPQALLSDGDLPVSLWTSKLSSSASLALSAAHVSVLAFSCGFLYLFHSAISSSVSEPRLKT